jgi:hypothetical protein
MARDETADWAGRGRTQVLKVMDGWLTPRLLSCSSSWNLMGNAGAMATLMRSAARDQREVAANLSKVGGQVVDAGGPNGYSWWLSDTLVKLRVDEQ